MTVTKIRQELRQIANPARAQISRSFFKTGPGQYGAGDQFIGVTVPQIRQLVPQCQPWSLSETNQLLSSAIHEERLLALLILVDAYARSDAAGQKRIYQTYLRSTQFINSWDLVDSSAAQIVGAYLWTRRKTPLRQLARSASLWERRIAVLATYYFIQRDEFVPTLALARQLLSDREDLIHKAVGWMLREVGKRDQAAAEIFLQAHCRQMPRTMLRYAIERFPEPLRQRYLCGRV